MADSEKRTASMTTRFARFSHILGQTKPGAGTFPALYTAPAGIHGVVTCINICETAAGATTFNIYLSETGAAVADGNALSKVEAIGASVSFQRIYGSGENGLFVVSGGILYAGSASGSVTFTALGYEQTVN